MRLVPTASKKYRLESVIALAEESGDGRDGRQWQT